MLMAMAMSRSAHALAPNDPYYVYSWYANSMGLPSAWQISTGSPSVRIAILDTGVITTTPDLGGRVLANQSATGSPPGDGSQLRHGTWVASSVAMGVNNGIGGTGIGDFTILPIVITNSSGHNSSDWIADGIRMAADQGARVINVSHSTLNYGLLDDAAAYARTKGALTFVAAGNSNAEINWTGWDNLIFVSGTGKSGGLWSNSATVGSSWGPYVDLSAPAEDILVADPVDPNLPAGYGIIDGTSFAAPIAGGAAALAWSINPDLTPEEVLAMLYGTTDDLGDAGWDPKFGHGRVHIGRVAAAAQATVPEPSALGAMALLTGGLLVRRIRTTKCNRAGRGKADRRT